MFLFWWGTGSDNRPISIVKRNRANPAASPPMRLFDELRGLRAFEKKHRDFFSTVEDHHLIGEIGYQQARGKPLTLKQLFLLDIGSITTVQRRLKRFKELDLVRHRRATSDRRAVELTLSPKCLRIFAKSDLPASEVSLAAVARASGEPRHVCALTDSDAGGRNLLGSFLTKGMNRGDKCVLLAPAEIQGDILAGVQRRQKARGQLIVSEGYESADALLAFFKRELQDARQAGRAMRVASHMAWTLSKNLGVEALLELETRLETLARQLPLTGLCVYDTRQFSSGDFLGAVKCHRDHSRYPIVLG